ncbi:MAG: thioredoxin fold domain-containing protein [Candidatus Delongbacteria bacterium]|nr:thioredoxin fold domain-containing protein [Candidatus Delongbacteria bacterium]MBN2833666.1 thioredoxin fold domain-containing protein [Candidatus Delongbacteria bacterium]
MKKTGMLFLILSMLLVFKGLNAEPIPADSFDPERDVKTAVFVDRGNLKDGDQFRLAVSFEIPEGYHITDSEYYYLNTESASKFSFEKPVFSKKDSYKGHNVFKNSSYIYTTGTFISGLLAEDMTISYGFQCCTEFGDESCFMPMDYEVVIDFNSVNSDFFEKNVQKIEIEKVEEKKVEESDDSDADLEEKLAEDIKTAGTWSLMIFIIAFLGGILDSMTPCVYPIIPVVISYMGAKSSGKKSAGFTLSLFFVLGLAFTYSIVGLLAAFLGGIFGVGDLAANPYVRTGIAIVFTVLAASMFGMFDINLVSSEQKAKMMQSGKSKSGFFGAIILGAVSGIIAAPCVGPVLAALLIHVATVGDMLYGWLIFLTFAFGLGLLFLLIGTFSGAIHALPQAGAWMMNIKKFFGFVMLGAAIFFVSILLPEYLTFAMIAILAMVIAVYIGGFRTPEHDSGFFSLIGKVLGLVFAVVSVVFILKTMVFFVELPFGGTVVTGNVSHTGEVHVPFRKTSDDLMVVEKAIDEIKGTEKLVMVDFWAEWCLNCKELDKVTWNVPSVVDYVKSHFIPVKLDITDKRSEFSKKYIEKFKDFGSTNPPVILFINSKGEVVEKIQGLVEGERMLKKLEKIKG